MPHSARPLLRLAIAVHDRARAEQSHLPAAELPSAAWQQCELLYRRLHSARQRVWNMAAARLQGDLEAAVQRLEAELGGIQRRSDVPQANGAATIRDIYADLLALQEDFDALAFDRKARTISVTTESIELEGVQLGPFEIRLDWSDPARGHPYNYRVVAVDPNPAASDESVTHPHVQDEALCEGDGRSAIRRALEQARLLDFFVLVANLLRTYNPSSPYVSLSDWSGVECADCGTSTRTDERSTCQKCDSTLCGECYVCCPGCDCTFCGECVAHCACCQASHCQGCLNACERCENLVCDDCLDDHQRCTNCHEDSDDEGQETIDLPAAA